MDNSNAGSNKSNEGFFKYMLNFDNEQKNTILNSLQYLLLAYGPINTLDYITSTYFPDYQNDLREVESWRLLGEMLLEIVFIFIYIFLLNKVIQYIPTYSGTPMGNLNWMQLVVTILVLRLNHDSSVMKKQRELQTRIGNKINGNDSATAPQSKKQSVVKISQPISRSGVPQSQPTHTVSRSDYINQHQNKMSPPSSPPQEQMSPTSNAIYGGPQNSLVNAAWPAKQENSGGQEGFQDMGSPVQSEPMAANSVLGGGMGSAW
jgi:hypothetical protein